MVVVQTKPFLDAFYPSKFKFEVYLDKLSNWKKKRSDFFLDENLN